MELKKIQFDCLRHQFQQQKITDPLIILPKKNSLDSFDQWIGMK
jgi:hypothetical protein